MLSVSERCCVSMIGSSSFVVESQTKLFLRSTRADALRYAGPCQMHSRFTRGSSANMGAGGGGGGEPEPILSPQLSPPKPHLSPAAFLFLYPSSPSVPS